MTVPTTVRLTTAQGIVRWLVAQRVVLDDDQPEVIAPFFPGVFAIFGHGNVTCLGVALEAARDVLPTYRGQNEQGMALAAIAYAKAKRRRQVMVATSSIGPGALNMVTAAGVAMANRLPLLLLSGDTFESRVPDPVLQQVEHFGQPGTTVNDAFRAVTRYWDRVTRPVQLVHTLPHALDVLLDPAMCGPVFLGLPQDVQAEAFDFPEAFFTPTVHRIARPRADEHALATAEEMVRASSRPLIVAGGGVHYSQAEATLARLAEDHRIPVVETVAGKSSLVGLHPEYVGPIGVTGSPAANRLAAEADLVLAIGTRLQDFTTGSWTVFADPAMQLVSVNVARFDAAKHRAHAVVGDARETMDDLNRRLAGWAAPSPWFERAVIEAGHHISAVALATAASSTGRLNEAQVIGAVHRAATPNDYVLTAAGGLPGELNVNWLSLGVGTFDCEYGFSCMGYELSGGWGAAMAHRDGEVFVLVGDGSYLMLNSDLFSSVLYGHKLVVVVCDNGGFAVINRLQVGQGGVAFANVLDSTPGAGPDRVDFAAHAASMGCVTCRVDSIAELEDALAKARAGDRTHVIVVPTDPAASTGGGAFWEVAVPEVSERAEVRDARVRMDDGRRAQRIGW